MCQLSAGDIISNLPRDAIDNILACLPLHEAARTSILSRPWRYMWANLPSLVFDRDTFTGTTQKTEEGILFAIHEVLLLKRVPIVKFVLSLPGLKSSPHIDPLVSFVSRSCCFKELTLHILEGDELYKLPRFLFSCVELTRLSLEYCVIEPPVQFKGFHRLVSLEIYHCSILPSLLSELISSCSLLEELKVTGNDRVEGHIQISAPNLRDLIFMSGFTSISFKYTPRLSSCVLLLLEGSTPTGESSNDVESFCNLVAIEDLKIDLDYYEAGLGDNSSVPGKLATSLNHLKSLTLGWFSFHVLYDVSLVLCLIRSSPNLMKLVFLEVQAGEEDGDLEQMTHLLEVQEWPDASLNSLREMEVDQITGEACELGFIKLLLAISPKLETITVSPAESVELHGRLEILAELTRFRRSSPLAEIIYKY